MNIQFTYEAINKQFEFTYTSENLNSILSKNNFLYSGEFYSIEEYENFKYWFIFEYRNKFKSDKLVAEKAFENFYNRFGFRIRGFEFEYDETCFE